MLGNFYVEFAFCGAVGTIISESGIEFILTEAVLAECSTMGFIRGKFYSCCTRIHVLVAIVLEQRLYKHFLREIPQEEYETYRDLTYIVPPDQYQDEVNHSDSIIIQHLQKYEDFLCVVIDGSHVLEDLCIPDK